MRKLAVIFILAVVGGIAVWQSQSNNVVDKHNEGSALQPIAYPPPVLSPLRFALAHTLPYGHAFQYFWLFDALANCRALGSTDSATPLYAQADALCFFGAAEKSSSATYLLYRLGNYHAFTGTFSLLQISIPHDAIATNGSINPARCKTDEVQQNVLGLRIRYLYSDDAQLQPEFVDTAGAWWLDEEALALELRRRVGNPLSEPAYQFTLTLGAVEGYRDIPNNAAHHGLPFNEDQFARRFLNPLEDGFYPLIEARRPDFKIRDKSAAALASSNITLTRFKVGLPDEHADPMAPLPSDGHWTGVIRLLGLSDTAPSCLAKPTPQQLEITLTLRNPRNAAIYTHTELMTVGKQQ